MQLIFSNLQLKVRIVCKYKISVQYKEMIDFFAPIAKFVMYNSSFNNFFRSLVDLIGQDYNSIKVATQILD